MLRFNSRALKGVLKEAAGNGRRLQLIRDRGIYLVTENGRLRHGQPRYVAYAEGCDPQKDADWQKMTEYLAGPDTFTDLPQLSEAIRVRIMASEAQLRFLIAGRNVEMFCARPRHTGVVQYRDSACRMAIMAGAHFRACRTPDELGNWRLLARRQVMEAAFTCCRRATPQDHHNFVIACHELHRRTRCVTPEGAIVVTTK
ncbi:TPA: DUF3085 domain-containing protein [Klebsiella oxytoca]|nr:DUF3085 domain-containing protein [Klebsiella oxytoca]